MQSVSTQTSATLAARSTPSQTGTGHGNSRMGDKLSTRVRPSSYFFTCVLFLHVQAPSNSHCTVSWHIGMPSGCAFSSFIAPSYLPFAVPLMMENIVRLRGNGSTPTIGVGAYSEGTNDDLNKAVWSGIAADPSTSIEDLVAQYARYHFGDALETQAVDLLFGLEQNWVGGESATNPHVLSTLAVAEGILAHTHSDNRTATIAADNWRLQMYLYRAYYDAYVQARYRRESLVVDQAKECLATASAGNTAAAIAAARHQLLLSRPADTEAQGWKAMCMTLLDAMNTTVGTEVIQGQVTSMNINSIDQPLSDAAFLLDQLELISKRWPDHGDDAGRAAAIRALLDWEEPGPGGFYDNLAPRSALDSTANIHLDPGQGAREDPAYYFSPLTTAEAAKVSSKEHDNATHPRLSWQSSAMAFYDSSIKLDYYPIDARANYTLEIVFVTKAPRKTPAAAGSTAASYLEQMQLLANSHILRDFFLPPYPMQKLILPVPAAAVAASDGVLTIECRQHSGLGGTGRTCNIAEVWLRKQASAGPIISSKRDDDADAQGSLGWPARLLRATDPVKHSVGIKHRGARPAQTDAQQFGVKTDDAPAASAYPAVRFSWETVPVFFHADNYTGDWNEAALAQLSKYPIVTIEKWMGSLAGCKAYGWAPCCGGDNADSQMDECEEDRIIRNFKKLKAVNKNVSTVLYLNSVLNFPQYRLARTMAANPSWALRDSKGAVVQMYGDFGPANMTVFDFSQAPVRAAFMSACTDAVKTGHVDGCFLDRAIDGFPTNLGPAKQAAYDAGHAEVVQTLAAAVSELSGGPLIANHAYNLTGVNSVQIENFGRDVQTGELQWP